MGKKLEKPDIFDLEPPNSSIGWFRNISIKYIFSFGLGVILSGIIFQLPLYSFILTYWLALLGGILLILSFLAIWLIPKTQIKTLKNNTDGEKLSEFDFQKECIKLQDDIRKTIAQIIGGLFFLISLLVTYNTLSLSKEGQITDRFSKAVNLLNDKSETISRGGLYSLERVAIDSNRDIPSIVDILATYIREKSIKPNQSLTDSIIKEAGNTNAQFL